MIRNAPQWLQPLLWIACTVVAGGVIVLLWGKMSTIVERLHVESMDAPPRSWKHLALTFGLLLLIVVVVVGLALIG